jgi:hypothetical protein
MKGSYANNKSYVICLRNYGTVVYVSGGHFTVVELTDERYVYCVVDNTVGDFSIIHPVYIIH